MRYSHDRGRKGQPSLPEPSVLPEILEPVRRHLGVSDRSIVEGRQPRQLYAKTLMRQASRLPADWSEQRRQLGFAEHSRVHGKLISAFEMSSEFPFISERTATGDFSRLS
jgi:hypothetical protein